MSAATEVTASGPRLQINPAAPTTAFVNGGWWPRTRVLTDELPGLLSELSPQLGPIALVGYHRNGWDQAPETIEFEHQTVRLQGFTADDPHTVIVIGVSGQRLTLRVVAPDSTEAAAHQLLAESAQGTANGEPTSTTVVDQSLAHVAARIAELEDITDASTKATILAWVEQAAAQFVSAPIQSFVPILVEHIVRSRIDAAPHGPAQ